jgi:tRNA threonylcarbamoyladenosine biosynthesis protein TsaB
MNVLALDTATPVTTVALARAGEPPVEASHVPGDGRPKTTTRLLTLVEEVLAAGGVDHGELDRIGVGVGPGSFTGLRIGLATAHGLALASGAESVGVSSLRTLALGAGAEHDGPVAAVIDARRGEVFVAAWHGEEELLGPRAAAPGTVGDVLAAAGVAPATTLAAGDGAVRFRADLERAGLVVPPDDLPLHRMNAAYACDLAAAAMVGDRAVLPHYVREPDALPKADR